MRQFLFFFPSFLFYKSVQAWYAITAHCVVLQQKKKKKRSPPPKKKRETGNSMKEELEYMLCKQHVDHLWSVVWCFSFFFFFAFQLPFRLYFYSTHLRGRGEQQKKKKERDIATLNNEREYHCKESTRAPFTSLKTT